tara:strand:- start:268 stop:450 length:183 start_codon:yes stop_codon:yes gene_type:complete
MNRNWNIVKGIRVGNTIQNNDENSIKTDIKIKRVVNYEFSKIIFTNEPNNINKYFKWIKG